MCSRSDRSRSAADSASENAYSPRYVGASGPLARAGAAPRDAEVAIQVDAATAVTILAPVAVAAPRVLIAVGIRDGHDPQLGMIDEVAHRRIAIVAAHQAIGDARRDHRGDPFARVLRAVEQHRRRAGRVTADVERPDRAALARAADRDDRRALGRERGELLQMRADRVVVAEVSEPIAGTGAHDRRGVDAGSFGGGDGIDVGDEDLPADVRGVELREDVVGDDDVERGGPAPSCSLHVSTASDSASAHARGSRSQATRIATRLATTGGCVVRAPCTYAVPAAASVTSPIQCACVQPMISRRAMASL